MKILIIGGNRFFGKKLAHRLVNRHDLYLLNRGSLDDGLGNQVERIKCDRNDSRTFNQLINRHNWDVVFDHCCFNAQQARDACHIFKGRVKKYIFISSQSVYDEGSNLDENEFDPLSYSFDIDADQSTHYAEAKRQAESVFFKEASFPVVAVRLPIVQGEDDYTKRLLFHINRVKEGEKIFFPDIEARISLIYSDHAAESLESLIELNFEGPVNIASSLPISLKSLMKTIEDELGRKAIYAKNLSQTNLSPYGIEADWFMNTQKLKDKKIHIPEISEWLPRFVKSLINKSK